MRVCLLRLLRRLSDVGDVQNRRKKPGDGDDLKDTWLLMDVDYPASFRGSGLFVDGWI